jgi:hypothetical protein
MRSPVQLTLSLLTLACVASGQTSATLQTATDVEALAWPLGGTSIVPARTVITSPLTVSSSNGAIGSASATIAPPGPLTMTLAAASRLAGIPGGNPSFAFVRGALDWTIPGAGYGQLTIAVTLVSSASSTSSASVTLDITGPGIHETYTDDAQRRTNYAFGYASQFTLRLGFNASASIAGLSRADATIQVQVDFVPLPLPPVLQQRYGAPCNATLTVADAPTLREHALTIVGTGGVANGVFVLVFGVRRTNVPLPGSPCNLLVEPAVPLVLTADGSGAFRVAVPIPGPLQSIPIDLQAIAMVPAAPVRASDGLEIVFHDL